MCGRISQEEVDEYFHNVYGWEMPENFYARRNIKPTQKAFIVARHPDNTLKTVAANWWCQWDGAFKFESKYPTFNAKVETMDDKKLWPQLLRKGKRCILPINWFYEWPKKGKGIPPVRIGLASRKPFTLPGLWSTWYDNGEMKYSFTVFTLEPNDFMRPIHPKAMPVILDDVDEQKLWLMEGDRELLTQYKGEMIAEELSDTLENLYPKEDS